ncbi:TPA: helix-turn-helix transcriptional regulator [Vibrio diabolicus]|uniref:helix-turn-helix domain-containing protein n=1 Tax=Vibrio diabolicus TaxID=50719 RepID=UPI00215D5C94|nr:helix-turn-helix transcriptional regulator [Vibrio diabolicus]MCR9307221.1 helix-turn-helix domain-containing protein [Vibrio diabolicus]
MKTLGEKIRYFREKSALTQKDFANQLEVSAQAVSAWERNLCKPKTAMLKDICKLLSVSEEAIISEKRIEKSNFSSDHYFLAPLVKDLNNVYTLDVWVFDHFQRSYYPLPRSIVCIEESSFIKCIEINDNLVIAINTKKKDISYDSIYVYSIDNKISIGKFINKRCNLYSVDWNIFPLDGERILDRNKLNIFGKVFWFSSKL